MSLTTGLKTSGHLRGSARKTGQITERAVWTEQRDQVFRGKNDSIFEGASHIGTYIGERRRNEEGTQPQVAENWLISMTR